MFNFSESKNGGWSNRSLAGYLLHVDLRVVTFHQLVGVRRLLPKARSLCKDSQGTVEGTPLQPESKEFSFCCCFEQLSTNCGHRIDLIHPINWLLMVSQPILLSSLATMDGLPRWSVDVSLSRGLLRPQRRFDSQVTRLGGWVPCGASKNMGCQWELSWWDSLGYSWDIRSWDRGNRFTYLSGCWKICQAAGLRKALRTQHDSPLLEIPQ